GRRGEPEDVGAEDVARGSWDGHRKGTNALRHRAGILQVDVLRREIHVNQIYSSRFDLLSARSGYAQ
ncbi:MAG TPA: hypothetical protein VHM28_02040, partial [Anaerolineales bacterium]|nr:hypothetical protein [Anaerolineales bacterium]